MSIEHIKSRSTGELLHIVISNLDQENQERINVIHDNEFLQLAVLGIPKGTTFKPHKHVYKKHDLNAIAQESWVILEGAVKVMFYDVDDSLLAERILNKHDVSITLRGGHNYLILSDNTKVLEYKTGPYLGQNLDKAFILEK